MRSPGFTTFHLKASLYFCFLTLLASACDFSSNNKPEIAAVTGAIVFNGVVDTPPIIQARVRIMQKKNDGKFNTIANKTLDSIATTPINFSLSFDLDRIDSKALDPYLSVQVFFSDPKGQYRKSFSRHVNVRGASNHFEIIAEQPVRVSSEGYFEEKQEYIHHLFVTDEACEDRQERVFVNCFQWMVFDTAGHADVVVTDIVNAGNYHIEGERITVEIPPGSGDLFGTTTFTFASDRQLLSDSQNELWINMPYFRE